ncbi:MAG: hypothetical protein K6C97_06735 [Treponema sp.]|nr:hypothetical protein [Treponema sp.]
MKSNNPVVSTILKNYENTQNAFLSKEVLIPLAQEHKLTYKSLVKAGDIVKEGEIIAKADNSPDETTYIHSPLPGKVLDILPCYCPNGKQNFAIKIKFGGALSFLGKKIKENPIETIPPASVISSIIDNGVVNTFKIAKPLNLGLEIKKLKNCQNLVVRMYDEDPFRITDSLVTKFYLDEIVKASKVLAKAIKAKGLFFAIDQKIENKAYFDNLKSEHIHILEMNLRKYPCGTPREIVSNFNRSLSKKFSDLTLTNKDLFIDASSMLEVYKAVICSIPSISKPVHFSGNCLKASCLLNVKIGSTLRDIVKQLGGFTKEPQLIIINGSICGTSVQSLDVPITKYVKSVEFISKIKKTNAQIYSCINCGNCRFACPVHLSPDILYTNTINFKFMPENFAASSIACIECGLCNTVCPARLPLSQTISLLKDKYTKE